MSQITQYPIADSALRWLEIILTERFGAKWHLSRIEPGLRLELDGAEGSIIFDVMSDNFIQAHSDQPCTQWDAESEGWHSVLGGPLPAPGFSNLPAPLIESHNTEHVIHYDILGLCYWMLARVEEVGRTDLDSHQRFQASSSHAFRHNYLERPIVDEWLYILKQTMMRQWPGIQPKKQEFRIRTSHDVDRPFQYLHQSPGSIARQVFGDTLKRKNLGLAWNRLMAWKAVRQGDLHRDPFYTLDWLMDISEKNSLVSAFYFICGRTDARLDSYYGIELPSVRALLRKVYQRGHEIGLHPSYNTYQNPAALAAEADLLRRVCEEEGIPLAKIGGRMHYLRWEQPSTFHCLVAAGVSYDSTLGYPDCAGFRCGTCFAYPAFDVRTGESLELRVRPLIAMEQSVFGEAGLGLSLEDGLVHLKALKQHCRAVGGSFNLLWHNSELHNYDLKNLYIKLIQDN